MSKKETLDRISVGDIVENFARYDGKLVRFGPRINEVESVFAPGMFAELVGATKEDDNLRLHFWKSDYDAANGAYETAGRRGFATDDAHVIEQVFQDCGDITGYFAFVSQPEKLVLDSYIATKSSLSSDARSQLSFEQYTSALAAKALELYSIWQRNP